MPTSTTTSRSTPSLTRASSARRATSAFRSTAAGSSSATSTSRSCADPREDPSMPRIVSLIASATEIVCALGFEGDLVGRSHECDYPPSVRRLPVVTEPKINVSAASGEIDRQIRSLVGDGLSVYRVDAERLEALEPDVIVTQSQCEVCAVSLRDVERAVCAWLRRCPQLVSLEPNSLADVRADVEKVALALGSPDRGADLLA